MTSRTEEVKSSHRYKCLRCDGKGHHYDNGYVHHCKTCSGRGSIEMNEVVKNHLTSVGYLSEYRCAKCGVCGYFRNIPTPWTCPTCEGKMKEQSAIVTCWYCNGKGGEGDFECGMCGGRKYLRRNKEELKVTECKICKTNYKSGEPHTCPMKDDKTKNCWACHGKNEFLNMSGLLTKPCPYCKKGCEMTMDVKETVCGGCNGKGYLDNSYYFGVPVACQLCKATGKLTVPEKEPLKLPSTGDQQMKLTDKPAFKPGDVVQLNSGGPKMTIGELEDDGKSCNVVWWSEAKQEYLEDKHFLFTLHLANLGWDPNQ